MRGISNKKCVAIVLTFFYINALIDRTYADLIPVSGRDLTAWKTSIPRVVSAVDSAGKPIWAFEVEIQRGDIRPEDDPEEYHWTVIRTYLEFFHLENKLTEFHGELVSNRLPQKKMFGTRNMKFLESVRPVRITFLCDCKWKSLIVFSL